MVYSSIFESFRVIKPDSFFKDGSAKWLTSTRNGNGIERVNLLPNADKKQLSMFFNPYHSEILLATPMKKALRFTNPAFCVTSNETNTKKPECYNVIGKFNIDQFTDRVNDMNDMQYMTGGSDKFAVKKIMFDP